MKFLLVFLFTALNITIFSNSFQVPLENSRETTVSVEEGKHLYFISEQGEQKLIYYKEGKTSEVPLWLSILPPLIAIIIALLYKEVILALFLGLFSGAFIYNGLQFNNIFIALMNVVDKYILNAVSDTDHMAIILFSLMIGGMVALISRNGGMMGIVNLFSKWANSARNAQLVTWFLGLAIFFDDYANTLIVGNALRPVTDKFKVSREKLSYIVDSTAAPIAAIAFVTTWIGAELGYIQGFIDFKNLSESAYGLFFSSLQYAFYPIIAIVFMFLLIVMERDFGPMLKAEKRARLTGKVSNPVDNDDLEEDLSDLDPKEGIKHNWYNAAIPILMVLGVTLLGLIITGLDNYVWNSNLGFFTNVSGIIGESNSYVALLWSSLCGLMSAIILNTSQKIMSLKENLAMMMKGISTMLSAIIILIFAWALAGVTKDLHTADFLSNLLSGNLPMIALPVVVFALAGAISFSTGSSWGTMAILYPIALPLTWQLGLDAGLNESQIISFIIPTIAVVLSGSVLGDHCSPISDTTILSSLATDCNHIDHVKTQLPYALTVGGISIILLVLGMLGIPFIINIALGIGMSFSVVKFIGKPIKK